MASPKVWLISHESSTAQPARRVLLVRLVDYQTTTGSLNCDDSIAPCLKRRERCSNSSSMLEKLDKVTPRQLQLSGVIVVVFILQQLLFPLDVDGTSGGLAAEAEPEAAAVVEDTADLPPATYAQRTVA